MHFTSISSHSRRFCSTSRTCEKHIGYTFCCNMTSALDTLLEAAKYIEQQEELSRQRSISTSSSQVTYATTFPPLLSGAHETSTAPRILSNNTNQPTNIVRYVHNQQATSPLGSPVLNSNTTANTGNLLLSQHQQFPTLIRLDGSGSEPLLNGHTLTTPPLVVFSHPPQQQHHTHSGSSTQSSPQSSFELSRSRSSSVSSNHPVVGNGATTTLIQHVLVGGGEDTSQSSLNLNGSSGYFSGSSVTSVSGLNLTAATGGNGITASTVSAMTHNGSATLEQIQLQIQSTPTGRRRTTSTNSNGGTQRSPCILRAGTREVHNKLEKNRRAHLKECFEQLKKQLPQMPEEKKTSNLSILSAAIRYIQTLKRKERELEHEMERLAKEKISSQQRIIVLKRELSSQYENIDFSTILPESDIPTSSIRERESSTEPLMPSSSIAPVRYGSSSSLASLTNVMSPSPGPVQISSGQIGSPVIASPTRKSTVSPHPAGSLSSHTLITPKNLFSTTTASLITDPISSGLISSTAVKIAMPGGATFTNPQSIATIGALNFTTTEEINSGMLTATNSSIPLSLNSTHHSQALQIISTAASGRDLMGKNGIRSQTELRDTSPPSLVINGKEQPKLDLLTTAAAGTTKLDTEPPTKVIKLINGSIALASVDKESKIIPSGQLTLSQMMGGSSLVVSPIPFLTPSQSLRVIGSSANGLATIELNPASASTRTQGHHTVPQTSAAQLHKLLATGQTAACTTTMVSTSGVNTSVPSVQPELARLPGGAELNVLPTGPNGAIYRGQSGKLAIVNNGFPLKGSETTSANNRAVHVVTPIQSNSTPLSGLTPIMVSQGQGTASLAHIIASTSQLTGKVVTTPLSMNGQGLPLVPGTQYLSTTVMKPMVVAMASSSNNPASSAATLSTTTPSTNGLPPSTSSVVLHTVAPTTMATNEMTNFVSGPLNSGLSLKRFIL
ncbi:mucin-2-like isoform X2 [Lutzomyia longipalpis]|uniref:mucin-2-like isoform X2 n=1 Tax=Lutzomyia longipalpis TaxID=7200 RepID=UPI002483F306|nr:mucin-2-like isoform X2 [Lutzomyia longipalpis]